MKIKQISHQIENVLLLTATPFRQSKRLSACRYPTNCLKMTKSLRIGAVVAGELPWNRSQQGELIVQLQGD